MPNQVPSPTILKLPLGIPDEADRQAIAQREAIIGDVFPNLLNDLNKPENKNLGFLKSFAIGDVEYAALACFSHLSKLDQITGDQLINMFAGPNFVSDSPTFAKSLRESCKIEFSFLKGTWLKKIRAKLAVLELCAVNDEPTWIPALLGISSAYLQSAATVRFIHVNRSYLHSKDKEKRKWAEVNLSAIARSITGDRRKIKSRKYNRWLVFDRYFMTTAFMQGARKSYEDGKLNEKLWGWLKEDWQLTDSEINRILRSREC